MESVVSYYPMQTAFAQSNIQSIFIVLNQFQPTYKLVETLMQMLLLNVFYAYLNFVPSGHSELAQDSFEM